MTVSARMLGTAVAAALIALISVGGCRSANPPASPTNAQPAASVLPVESPVEDSKAREPLDEIEPRVEAPRHPADLAPLSERSQKQVEKAQDLLGQRRFTEAAIELEKALRYDPNHPAVHAVLARLHWQAGNTERAKTHAERAIEDDSSQADPHYVLARYFGQAEDSRRALLEFRTVLLCRDLAAHPEVEALTHHHLGRLLSAEGYYAAALDQFDRFREKAAELQRGGKVLLPEAVNVLADAPTSIALDESVALEKLGRLDEAADALRPLAKAQPQNLELAMRYANLLLQTGRTDEALAAAQSIESDDEKVIWLLFTIYERRGEAERAIEEIRARLDKGDGDSDLILRLADVLLRLERPADAAKALEESLTANPDLTAVRAKLVQVLVQTTEWERALGVAAEGIQLQPQVTGELEGALLQAADAAGAERMIKAASGKSDFAATYLAGAAALKIGDRERAKNFFTKAAGAKADFAPVQVALGRFYLDEFDYDRALEAANRAQELAPQTPDAEMLLGAIYDRLDQTDLAEQHYKAASQLDRTQAEAILALAQLYFRTAQTRHTQLVLQNLLQTSPNNVAARELLSMAFAADGKRDLAVAECEQIRNLADAPTALARCLARVDLALQRDLAARRRMLADAMEKSRPDADTWVAIGVTYGSEAYEARREAFMQALTLDPSHEDALAGLYETEKELGLEFESAATWLEKLLKKRPNQHQLRRELAILYTLINDFPRAVTLVEPYVDRAGFDEKERDAYRSVYIGALRAAHEDQRVTEELKGWAGEDTVERKWTINLGDHYYAIKEYSKAAETYAGLIDGRPEQSLQRRLVVALVGAKQHDRAAHYALEWLNVDPANDLLVSLLSAVLADAKKLDAALELVRNQLLRTPNREDFQDWMVGQLAAADRHEASVELAETLLDHAISVLRQPQDFNRPDWDKDLRNEEKIYFPNSPLVPDRVHERMENLRLRLVSALFLGKDYRRASDLLNEWLEATNEPSTRFMYLRTLAGIQQAEGHEEAASGTMERALLLRPSDAGLNNDLSYTWIDRGIRLADAEPMIRYAVGRAPAHAAYLDTFGWLHYKKGNFEEAKKWLERANAARGEEDPVILDHLGDCAWRTGQKEQALARWNRSIEVLNEREGTDLANADERRASKQTPKKVEDAAAGRTPEVAPLEQPDQGDPGQPEQGKEQSKSGG